MTGSVRPVATSSSHNARGVVRPVDWNKILPPSGDQCGFAQFGALIEHTDPLIDVICTGFEPSALAIQISSQPVRFDANAMRRPSDEKSGLHSS